MIGMILGCDQENLQQEFEKKGRKEIDVATAVILHTVAQGNDFFFIFFLPTYYNARYVRSFL